MIEVAPVEAPLTVLVLGRSRVLPVRITEFSVTEEAFDASLNPIRAKVSVGVRVLTVDDLGFSHQGGAALPAATSCRRSASPALSPDPGRPRPDRDLKEAAHVLTDQPLLRDRRPPTFQLPDGRRVIYVRRRFLPRPGRPDDADR